MTDILTETDEVALAAKLARSRGGAGIDWSTSVKHSPRLMAAYQRMAAVAADGGALEPKMKDLILIAVNASTTSPRPDALRRHIRSALASGATAAEIAEVFEVTSVLGVHSLTVGVPVLLDLLAVDGKPAELPQMDARRAELKQAFIINRGYWTDLWEAVLRLAPDYFEAYTEYSSVPWKHGPLPPKDKELIYVAITASTTHLFEPGIRVHAKNALGYGATPEEIMGVLELVSLLGIDTLTVGMPILEEELRNAHE
jgi:alkylhydroperoxidase/carboxymuconolactone decarboxylase family protein YurZ